MRIYVASSWRNARQPAVVAALRAAGHDPYDFRNPAPGQHGFAWSEIDPAWQTWTPEQFREALQHPTARRGFRLDWAGMEGAQACVLVLPCNRSAHLEAGYFVGKGRPLVILLERDQGPELMYRMASALCTTVDEVLERLDTYEETAARWARAVEP